MQWTVHINLMVYIIIGLKGKPKKIFQSIYCSLDHNMTIKELLVEGGITGGLIGGGKEEGVEGEGA